MLVVVLVVALCAQPALALTLTEAVRTTWRGSRLLEGQQDQLTTSANDRWRRFVPNEPTLAVNNNDDGSALTVGLQLVVPLPPKTIANTRLDAAKEAAQRAELFAKRFELTKNTVQTFVDCATSRSMAALQNQFIDDNQTLAGVLRAKYAAGSATQAENIGIELQIRQLHADLAAARDKAETACRKLGWLIGNAAAPDSVDLGADLDDEILGELGTGTPDEARARVAATIADAAAAVAWWSQLPDLTLQATKNKYLLQPASPSGRVDTWSYGVQITLPIFFPFKETVEAGRARSQAAIDRGNAELQLIAARSDKADAAREYARSRRRLDELHERDLSLAEAQMESALSAYRSGKLGFAEITLARKTLSDLRAQELLLRGAIISAHLRCLNECNETKGTTP